LTSLGTDNEAHKCSGRNHSEHGSNKLERLIHMQLEEKENVIRQQQASIQELRVQITNEQRAMGARNDELAEKLRNCERERNDLRTRLAQELRVFQGSKDDLLFKISNLENEMRHMVMTTEHNAERMQSEGREREAKRFAQLDAKHRSDVLMLDERNRQTLDEMETLRGTMQNEIAALASQLEQERAKYNDAR